MCPDESQKSLPDLGKPLKASPLQLYPASPRTPAEKPLKKTQDLVLKFSLLKFPLDTQLPFFYIQATQSEVL